MRGNRAVNSSLPPERRRDGYQSSPGHRGRCHRSVEDPGSQVKRPLGKLGSVVGTFPSCRLSLASMQDLLSVELESSLDMRGYAWICRR
jgi:hypothetical protein